MQKRLPIWTSTDNRTLADQRNVTKQVAPVWTNAYAYMVMGRMVYNFTPSASVLKVPAWRFGLIFVALDILAFLVQVGGALIASGSDKPEHPVMLGLHVYMGGIGFQQVCIFAFLALAVRLHRKILLMPDGAPEKRNGLILLYVNYAVVTLITIRISWSTPPASSPPSRCKKRISTFSTRRS